MSLKFFLFDLRRSWPKMFLYMLVFMFFLPVIYLLIFPDIKGYIGLESFSKDLMNLAVSTRPLWTTITACVAVFAGCAATSHLGHRTSADFYHSLPLKREELYTIKYAVGVADFLVAFVLNSAAVLIIFVARELAPTYSGLITSEILKNIGCSLLTFFSVYSVTIFSGMLCGTTIMQLITFFYLNFYPVVAVCGVVGTISMFSECMLVDCYINTEVVLGLMPIGRLIACGDYLKGVHIWSFIIADVVIVMLSLALYKARRTEKAGTPIIFKGYERIFRYSVLFLAAILGGLFFDVLIAKTAWVIFGVAAGTFISFLLLNTIIAKNARKMFSGIKAFAVCCVIIAVLYAVLFINGSALDSFVPSESSVTSMNLSVSGSFDNIEFIDDDVISAMIQLDKQINGSSSDKSDDDNKVEAAETFDADRKSIPTPLRDTLYFTVIYKTRGGLRLARTFYVAYNDLAEELFEAIARSDEYAGYFNDFATIYDFNDYSSNFSTYENILSYDEYYYDDDRYDLDDGIYGTSKSLYNSITSGVDGDIYDYFQNTNLMSFVFYQHYKYQYSVTVPVTTGNTNAGGFLGFESIDAYIDYLTERISSVTVYKLEGDFDDALMITDKEQIREITLNLASLCYYNVSPFTKTDNDYSVIIDIPGIDGELTSAFLYGRIPSFVSEAFK